MDYIVLAVFVGYGVYELVELYGLYRCQLKGSLRKLAYWWLAYAIAGCIMMWVCWGLPRYRQPLWPLLLFAPPLIGIWLNKTSLEEGLG